MKKLLRYLSPFAPDQSGVSGVLYELGGLIVICDAGGCSGNICGFDEPRWFTKKSAVFSAGLRDMDAIMGRDDKLIEKLAKAQEKLKCSFTALIATPVPAVIGTDMKALKRMAEKKTGVPCISINAIGTRYYDEGESLAWYELFREFAGRDSAEESDENTKASASEDTTDRTTGGEKKLNPDLKTVGIIGATPLETGYSSSEVLMDFCKGYGINEPVIYGIGTGLDAIRYAGNVQKNLVVSAAGLKAARYLKDTFSIPYEVGYPFIPEVVTKAVETFVDRIGNDIRRVLIVHSQFAANELRSDIRAMTENSTEDITIDCATFFMQEAEYAETGDIMLSGEDELWEIAESNKYDLVIGDTDIKRLFDVAGYKGSFVEFPEFAISGIPMDDGKTLA